MAAHGQTKEKPKRKMENPLRGWPRTRPLRKEPGFKIVARYLTPNGAKFTDIVGGLLLTGLFVLIFAAPGMLKIPNDKAWYVAGAIVAIMVALWMSRYAWGRILFGGVAVLQFLPDTIRIRSGFRYRNYDRNLPHEFTVSPHDKSQDEEDLEVRGLRKGTVKGGMIKYYRQSYHVTLRYAGQRVDIASVFRKPKAEAFLVRLQLLDQLMDAERGESTASPFAEAETQYGERPAAG